MEITAKKYEDWVAQRDTARNPYQRPTGIYIGSGAERQEIMAAPGGATDYDKGNEAAWAKGQGSVENRALREEDRRMEEDALGQESPEKSPFMAGTEITTTETTGADGRVSVQRKGISVQQAENPGYYAGGPRGSDPNRSVTGAFDANLQLENMKIRNAMREPQGTPNRKWAEYVLGQRDRKYGQLEDERNRRAALEVEGLKTQGALYGAQGTEAAAQALGESSVQAAEMTGKYGVKQAEATAQATATEAQPEFFKTNSGVEFVKVGKTVLQVRDYDTSMTGEEARTKLGQWAKFNWKGDFSSEVETTQDYYDATYDEDGNRRKEEDGSLVKIDRNKEFGIDQMNFYQNIITGAAYFKRVAPPDRPPS